MSNRNRHMQYRKSIYRKRRIRGVVISCAVAIILAFALFMIIGTALHSKAEKPPVKPTETEYKESSRPLPTASAVGAYPLPLLEDGSKFSQRLADINENANAVCINLNSTDGTLLYRSELAASLPTLSVHKDAAALSSSLTAIERKGLHASALLYLAAFERESDLLTDVELATIGAISCEAFREGVGDILFVAPDMSVSDVSKACSLADDIHSTVENAIVGITLSNSILADENSASLIDTLSKHFNFLALDTTSYKLDEDPVTFIEGKISGFLLEILYYKMRVLLPTSADKETQQKYVEAAEKYNIQSWQMLP